MRQDKECGSMTLIGIWMLSIMLFVSSMLYIFSTKETEVSIVERNGYKMQLMLEGVMEQKLMELQEDFARADEMYRTATGYFTPVDEGDIGSWHYKVRYVSKNNSLWLYGELRNAQDKRLENVFGLRWRLHVDEEEESVSLEGIG